MYRGGCYLRFIPKHPIGSRFRKDVWFLYLCCFGLVDLNDFLLRQMCPIQSNYFIVLKSLELFQHMYQIDIGTSIEKNLCLWTESIFAMLDSLGTCTGQNNIWKYRWIFFMKHFCFNIICHKLYHVFFFYCNETYVDENFLKKKLKIVSISMQLYLFFFFNFRN